MTVLSGNWWRRLLVGGVLYLLYALVALAFLTGVVGKRVVAALVFSPYQAVPPSAAIGTQLIKTLVTPPAKTASTAQKEGLRFPDLQIFDPYDIHTVGSQAGGDLRLKFGTMIWNAGTGPLETRGARNPETKQLEVYQYLYPRGAGKARQGKRIGTFDYNHRHGHLHLQTVASTCFTSGRLARCTSRVNGPRVTAFRS